MLQVHVISRHNRHLYRRVLDEHHAVRHRIYVEELKWRGLTSRADGREYDQFDTDETVYLLGLEGERLIGGLRLLPTTSPHLMSEVFPHFADIKGVPCQPDIAEWTRIFVIPERREDTQASSTIIAAVMDYALDEGLAGLSVVMNTFWLPRFLKYGWRARPLGLPAVHDGEWLVAVLIDVTPEALASIRQTCGLPRASALVRRGPQHPFIPEVPHVSKVA